MQGYQLDSSDYLYRSEMIRNWQQVFRDFRSFLSE